MSERQVYSKDNPHKDIGKQKFRVRKHYSVWVEYDVVADNKDEAQDVVFDQGGIEKIEWKDGYHKDEPVEVYATDWDWSDQDDQDYKKYRGPLVKKVAECVPYEDSDGIYFDDPNWTESEFEWQVDENKASTEDKKDSMEVPF
jgi:hypothetical protein